MAAHGEGAAVGGPGVCVVWEEWGDGSVEE